MTHETTDNAQIETQIVPVLPRVSGYIKMINVRDFDSVSKGQLVAEIDDEELQNQLSNVELSYRKKEQRFCRNLPQSSKNIMLIFQKVGRKYDSCMKPT